MATRDIRDFMGQPLEWKQPNIFQRVYELRVGDEVLATLAKQGVFKSAYDAWTPEGQWTIRREGFWQKDFAVLDTQGNTIANGHTRMSGKAELWTASGNGYQWKNTNFWGTQWEWRNLEGMSLIAFHKKNVTILPAATDVPDLVLLAILARYLKIIQDDANAAATAAATT
ncbi:hypothetical protein [Ktedonospora formicarum]|uniref:Uncharacterized protein n=1 Tax=Ktedonospora formicarum TaxID=2778364 RepID=A0A8J3MVI1_9CHLR|nr:hypothetical protein [Ktedonospora formicarum]GHO47966.1 hypothetical protein KSX_61290 [Ktedonospora formicarum]